jgi:hypothetical protein
MNSEKGGTRLVRPGKDRRAVNFEILDLVLIQILCQLQSSNLIPHRILRDTLPILSLKTYEFSGPEPQVIFLQYLLAR